MKKIIITIGDPAGCGPYITLKSITALQKEKIEFFVVGDEVVLKTLPLYKNLTKRINLINANAIDIEKLKFGQASLLSGKAALNYLNIALAISTREKISRLVTAPLSKEAVAKIYPSFVGHTEYLAEYFKVKKFTMMMVSPKLKTVLFTRHIPLRNVSWAINRNAILSEFTLVYSALQKMFAIANPKIAVCAVNPHAGVDTFLDKEDKMISKAINIFSKKVYGPYPADTLFTESNLKQYDCIICAYHDQAMIPFKLLSFKQGVNLTLGLPIIRTSPAHGTAFDLIRDKKTPFYQSMLAAIKLALKLEL